MKRPHEDVVESNKKRKEDQHITPECVGEKRRQEDSYDSQFSLKIPKLDIQEPVPLSSHGLSKPGMYNIYVTTYTMFISNNRYRLYEIIRNSFSK